MFPRLPVLTATAIALVLAAALPALAAKGGNGGGKGNDAAAPTTQAWVSASPNPASAGGERVYLTGCGYAVAPVVVRVHHSAGNTEEFAMGMWNTGCLDTGYFATREAGTYTIEVRQQTGRALELVATTSLEVR